MWQALNRMPRQFRVHVYKGWPGLAAHDNVFGHVVFSELFAMIPFNMDLELLDVLVGLVYEGFDLVVKGLVDGVLGLCLQRRIW